MDDNDRPVPPTTAGRRPGRRRELTAGALAIVLTALTAGVAVWVNADAATPDVPSHAGTADRLDLIARVDASDVSVATATDGTATDAVTDPSAVGREQGEWSSDDRDAHEQDEHQGDSRDQDGHERDSHERDSHERESHDANGHDDDD